MTVATVRAKIAIVQAAIPGIKRAYTQLPQALVDADCPQFVTFAREAEFEEAPAGSDMYVEHRQYLMWLLVAPRQSGIVGEVEAITEPWLDTVGAAFRGYSSMGVAGVLDMHLEGDSGPAQLTYGDVVFWGIEFRLRVRESQERLYHDGE